MQQRADPSSHVLLRWVSPHSSLNTARYWGPLVAQFSQRLLEEYERLHEKYENSGGRMRYNAAQERVAALGHVSIFLRDLLEHGNFEQRVREGHQFVLAVARDPFTRNDQVVGITDVMDKGQQIQGQFTCVDPSLHRMGIGRKLHRAIHGYARRVKKEYFGGNLSPGMLAIYRKWKENPPGHSKDKYKLVVPSPRVSGPHVTVKFHQPKKPKAPKKPRIPH